MSEARDKVFEFRSATGRKAVDAAFTLVELLAVVITLGFVAVLILPTLVRAKQKTLQAACQSNLKQIGCALQTYANVNHDFLPGPVFALAAANYDQTSSNQLIWFLADQLGCARPSRKVSVASPLLCPARGNGEPGQSAANRGADYVLNDGRALPAPPFGRPEPTVLYAQALSLISASTDLSACIAMTDADKGNVNATMAGWNGLPYQPVHGALRNQLYFDWHVGSKSW